MAKNTSTPKTITPAPPAAQTDNKVTVPTKSLITFCRVCRTITTVDVMPLQCDECKTPRVLTGWMESN